MTFDNANTVSQAPTEAIGGGSQRAAYRAWKVVIS